MVKSTQAKYRILGLVGRGQFGRVYCARDRLSKNKLVALKDLEQRRLPTNQFLRELRFLISLRHINIVSCISLDYSQNRRYLVMEYCEAGTLRNLIEQNLREGNLTAPSFEKRSLHLRQQLNLVLEVLSGLIYAHSLNIVHCDIKPENILLKITKSGWQAKISDFGIARLGQENDKSDNTGSPGYMAPERFYGQFSTASDLYAVGVILYELLVKERPFSGNPTDLMYAHLNQRVKVPDYIPNSLKLFLYKALEKLPARRFTSAQQMQDELRLIIYSESMLDGSNNELLLTKSINKLHLSFKKTKAIIKKDLSEPIAALGFFDNSQDQLSFYSATDYLLEKRNLSLVFNLTNSYEFKEKIIDLIITKNQEFIVTNKSISIITNNFENHQVLYFSDQIFHWAIANTWFAILSKSIQKSDQLRLQIYYLANLDSPKILDLAKTDIVALLKISKHHLAIVSNTNQRSNISVISRRGNLMAEFGLPVRITKAIASCEDAKIILITELNYMLIVECKPYRVHRIELGYCPQLIKATKWGYIICQGIIRQGETDTLLNFMDDLGNYVGDFAVDGLVKAIACISNYVLVISVNLAVGGRLLILDLKQLELDLVF